MSIIKNTLGLRKDANIYNNLSSKRIYIIINY